MADLTGKRVGARDRISELRAALADTTAVHQITLTGPLALTVPTDFPAGQVYRVTLTQDGTGGHTVAFAGSPLAIDGAANARTLVEFWPLAGGSWEVTYPDAPVTSSSITDATAAGRAVLTAATQSAARAAIGAGTSNLTIGTTSGTAAAGSRQATETAIGMVELATTAEATAGTDTTRAVTPAGVKAVADTKAPASGQAAVNTLTPGTTVTIPATHSMHRLTMTGNTTLAFSNPTAGHAFTLKLSGAFVPTFPASVTWAGGTAPAYVSGKVYEFATFDAGTTWIGRSW